MKPLRRVLLVVASTVVVWQGARFAPLLFRKPSSHRIVVVNAGRRTVESLQVRVGRQHFDGGPLEGRDSLSFTFRVARDVPLGLAWVWSDRPGEDHEWNGGRVAHGPLMQRFRIVLRDDGGILYHVVPAPEPTAPQSG